MNTQTHMHSSCIFSNGISQVLTEGNGLTSPTLHYTLKQFLSSRPTDGKMENTENSERTFNETYNKLICQDDFSTEDGQLDDNQDQQKVSMSMVRPGSSWQHYRLVAVCLGLLSALLLVVDIGLGVYYNKLREAHPPLTDMAHLSHEITKLQAAYMAAIQTRDEARREFAKEISQLGVTKWELEHQKRRSKDYDGQIERIQDENAQLQSHLPLNQESCRHCMPRFRLLNSMCYYFPFSDTISKRSWREAREDCKSKGADLAIIDSMEKQLSISKLINDDQDPSRPMHHSGFWIGLKDDGEEGTWRWLSGTMLTEGYWNDGEPNDDLGNEDCAAVYPRSNPFKAWNDAPCGHSLKWICEMAPISKS